MPVAHDASGSPAIDWVLDHPDRVSALMLLNTHYCLMPTVRPPGAIVLLDIAVMERRLVLEARVPVNDWRIKDNTARPHSALSYLTPTECARAWTIHSTARRRPIP